LSINDLTWEYTYTAILSTTDINSVKTINLTGYKSIKVTVTFPSADTCTRIYDVNALYSMGSAVLMDTFMNNQPQTTNYWAMALVHIKKNSINLKDVKKGSAVGTVSLDVVGLK
jgi:hypothetical protein